jgi:hypothetical protein
MATLSLERKLDKIRKKVGRVYKDVWQGLEWWQGLEDYRQRTWWAATAKSLF